MMKSKPLVLGAALGALFLLSASLVVKRVSYGKRYEVLRAYGIEQFNGMQMEVWRKCQSIGDPLEQVFNKVAEFDDFSRERWDQGRQLIMPSDCLMLEDMAKQNYAERVRREGK